MKSGFGDLLPQVDSVARRLEQQCEAMNRFSQTMAQQDDVLDLLAEGLARWKASRKSTQDLQL